MSFSKETNRVPTGIGAVTITLFDQNGAVPNMRASVRIIVDDANGVALKIIETELLLHITTAQKNALIAFMGDIRTQAAAEILP